MRCKLRNQINKALISDIQCHFIPFVVAAAMISVPVEVHGSCLHSIHAFDLQQLQKGILANTG